MLTSATRHALVRAGWVLLLGLSVCYWHRAIQFRFLVQGKLGPDLLNKQLWFFGHLIAALPVLFGAPCSSTHD